MHTKLIYITVLALVSIFAFGLPADNGRKLTVKTDDVELFEKADLSPIFKFLDSEESRAMSYDQTGLKLKGVHIHHKPKGSHSHMEPSASAVKHLDTRDPIAACWVGGCNTDAPLKWYNATQGKAIADGSCWFVKNTIQNVNISLVFTIYSNALCADNVRCNLVGGVEVIYKASTPEYLSTLVDSCFPSLVAVADSCGEHGGIAGCREPSLTDQSGGLFNYFLMPFQDVNDPCHNLGIPDLVHTCVEYPCDTYERYCDGSDWPPPS